MVQLDDLQVLSFAPLSRICYYPFMTVLKDVIWILGFVLWLGGCTSIITATLTTPVWFILALLMPFLPQLRRLWSGWTWLMFIQFALIACLGFMVLSLPDAYPRWEAPAAQFLWVAMIFTPLLIWLSWRLGHAESATPEQRWLSVGLQFITMAIAALLMIVNLRAR